MYLYIIFRLDINDYEIIQISVFFKQCWQKQFNQIQVKEEVFLKKENNVTQNQEKSEESYSLY